MACYDDLLADGQTWHCSPTFHLRWGEGAQSLAFHCPELVCLVKTAGQDVQPIL